MKILQVSDIHFGAEDADALRAVERLYETQVPDALVVCGDLTQRGKHTEFAAARRWVEQFDCPKLVVPGNHDTPLLNIATRVAAPFRRFEEYFGRYFQPLKIGDWHFAGLNTARGWQSRSNWAEGVVDLNNLRAAASGSKYRAIVCHHPFVAPPGTPFKTATKRGQEADRLLQISSAQLLLTGHVHAPAAEARNTEKGGYLSVTAGTLSVRLRHMPPSCNLLDFSGDSIAIDTHVCRHVDVVKSLGKFDLSLGTTL